MTDVRSKLRRIGPSVGKRHVSTPSGRLLCRPAIAGQTEHRSLQPRMRSRAPQMVTRGRGHGRSRAEGLAYATMSHTMAKWLTAPITAQACQTSWKPNTSGRGSGRPRRKTTAPTV